mmetsp:Transcript_42484/g.74508  ORF Transcript_42484/g.74508 Transcript_42484/m.74508 type:complete len:442 (+) Transcript_42484:114-1439(+)
MGDDKNREVVDSYLLKRYEIGRCIGRGAYGIVWKVTERETGRRLALKKCFDAFSNSTDAQRTFREIVFLQELNGHENIVRLMNVLRADNQDDIYVLFDAMESDLSNVIAAGFLMPIHHEYITYQILKALKYIHSGGVLHRDLKPSNVLLNSNCHARICDFGLARTMVPGTRQSVDNAPMLTDYVATRWYRAPELLLGAHMYNEGVDMWSVGCIVGEMMSGKPVLKGRSTINQLERIIELTGKPNEADARPIVSNSQYARQMLDSIGPIRQLPSTSVIFLVKAPKAAKNLVIKMLMFNPDKRPSADVSLEDAFVEKFHLQEAEPTCDRVIRMPISDNNKMKADDYRVHIYQQIAQRRQQQKMDGTSSRDSSRRSGLSASLSRPSTPSRRRSLDASNGTAEGPEVPWKREGGSAAPPTTPNTQLAQHRRASKEKRSSSREKEK